MPSDAHYGHIRRAGRPEALYRGSGSGAGSSRPTRAGSLRSSRAGVLQAGGAFAPDLSLSSAFQFPPTFMDIERYNRDKEERTEEEERLGYDPTNRRWRPALDTDTIAAPEHLILPTTDEDGEQLPDEYHTSYPFGNLYAAARSAAPHASLPKLSPRLHMNMAMASAAGARNKDGANAAAAPEIDGALPPHMVLRAKTQHVPRVPDWPFVKFGPGSGGHASLLRAQLQHPAPAYREVWADLAFDRLAPQDGRLRPDPAERVATAAGASTARDADPLYDGVDTGIGASGGLTLDVSKHTPAFTEFLTSLGAQGEEQFPTGMSGAAAHFLSETEDKAARWSEAADDHDAEARATARSELDAFTASIAQQRAPPAWRPGGPRGKRFVWGRGWIDE